jgi:hypothetical protein
LRRARAGGGAQPPLDQRLQIADVVGIDGVGVLALSKMRLQKGKPSPVSGDACDHWEAFLDPECQRC